jgi:hypothetical protein
MAELLETHPAVFISYTRMDLTTFRELVEMALPGLQRKDKIKRFAVSVKE